MTPIPRQCFCTFPFSCAGSIPPELGKMRALRKLSIHHNLLTGEFRQR